MSEELSRVEDLLENGVEQPVLPMSELEAILRGEKIKPHSRVAELLLQYNPQDILIEKRINENGTYYASVDNADGYFKVIVDTPVIPPVVLDHLVETITENGTYNYTPEHDGYSDAEITVDVPKPQPVVASKTITANGTYVAADEQLDGYSQAVVNVPATPLDTMNITHNGTYHPPTGRGFDEVNVAVPLGTKTITENGTYTATDDNLDGYSSVAVDVPQIGIKDIPNTPTPIATFNDGSDLPLKSLTASIVPVQSGSGDPSPENVRPISGWTEEVITRCGKNWCPTPIESNVIYKNGSNRFTLSFSNDGTITWNITSDASTFFVLKVLDITEQMVGLTFTMSYSSSNLDDNNSVLQTYYNGTLVTLGKTATITSEMVGKTLGARFYKYGAGNYIISNIQVELGDYASTYEPYAGTTTTIPFTDSQGNPVEVYGGSVDVVNGKGDDDREKLMLADDISWTKYGSYEYGIRLITSKFDSISNNLLMEKSMSNILTFRTTWGEGEDCIVFGSGVSKTTLLLTTESTGLDANSSVDDVKAWLRTAGAYMIAPLATPTTFYTQPTSIKSLDGVNNVFASTGEILSGQYFGYVYPELGTKTITENGTYTATDDNLDGYSQVTIDVAGGGGSEPSEFYRYIPAVNGTIVLRQKYTKVLGQYEVENKVFFNGYHLTDYDTIPAEIYNYIPDIDVSGANWTDNTSTTQDGWISVAKHTYNQLRCYTQSWGSYLSNIDIWAVVDFTGGNGQTLPWSDPYDVDPTPDITLINAQISSISNKYMGAISTNLPVVAGYYAISHYNSDQIAGGTNLALVKIESLPTTITLGGLANFRLNITSNSVEVDNYDGSAKDVYMSIIKIPEYAICIKPD